jgi:hypothetical protein
MVSTDESQNWVFRHTFYDYRIGNRGGVVNNKTHSAQKYNVVIFWNLFILPLVDKAKVGSSDLNSNAISLAGEFTVLSQLAW